VTNADGEIFGRAVGAILERYRRQNGLPPLAEARPAEIAARLWILITVRGLPPPLGPGETGTPGEMTAEEVAPLVGRMLGDAADAGALGTPARQLVKACFQPEFKKCRDSYREVSEDGACRRQRLGRAGERVSGSHCVDCPYWTALTLEQHEKFLAKAWIDDAAEFAAHRDVFLPEDFRALRRFVRELARGGS